MTPVTISGRTEAATYHALRLLPHSDLKRSIMDYARKHNIRAGSVVTCVGSLEQYNIRFANQENAVSQTGHFEIVSLTGTFATASSHLHIALSDHSGATIGGHLMDNNLVYTTAEIVLLELQGLEFVREKDDVYGYLELNIRPIHR